MAEKKVFAAIKEVEAQIEAAHKRRQQRLEELLKEYLQAREPLLQRRYELVTGRSEPTDKELEGFKPQGAAAAAAADAKVGAGASGGGGKVGAGASGGGGKGSSRGVPFFWLNALCNEETLATMITPRDRCALEYLEDVRYVTGPMGLSLEFHFAPNPYFHNKVLRKGLFVKRRREREGPEGQAAAAAEEGGGPAAMSLGGLGQLAASVEEWREEHTVIDWKAGRSLLVRSEQQQRPKQQPAAAVAGKKAKKAAAGKGSQGPAAGGNKGKKGPGGGKPASTAAAPSRSKRHHGKHPQGPAPDLPDPEEEEEEEEEEEQEGIEEEKAQEQEGEVAGGRGGTVRRRPCPSFFRFFLPLFLGELSRRKEEDPTLEDSDDEDDDEDEDGEEEQAGGGEGAAAAAGGAAQQQQQQQQQRRQMDSEVLDVVVKRVIPRAVHLYLAGPAGAGPTAGGCKAHAARAGAEGDAAEEEEGYTLVSGSPAGDVASLALGAQRALHALMGLQRQLDELAAQLKRSEWGAWVEQMRELERQASRRRTLLVGPAGATTGKLSIPAFWLRALRAVPYGSLLVQHRDERALSYLADVRLIWDLERMPSPEEPHRTLDLELEFLPSNPYFTNQLLRKRFTFQAPGGSLNRMWVVASKSDPIDWQPGRDLTTSRVAPPAASSGSAGGSGGGGGGRGAGRARKVPSFFALFDDSCGALCRAFGIAGGQSAAALHEANQAQEQFMGELINVVVQFAGALAAESNVDVDDLGDEREEDEEEDEEEEEDEDEEEDDEDDEDEGEGGEGADVARRAARRAAALAARRRGGAGAGGGGGGGGDGGGVAGLLRRLFGGGGASSGGLVMAVFVVIMLLAQVLMFFDTLDYVRARFKWAP